MAETLSQSDLDALFGDLAAVAAEPAAETSELDKLMSDLASLSFDTGNEKPVTPSVDSLSDNESLSQDQVDELLKQFLG